MFQRMSVTIRVNLQAMDFWGLTLQELHPRFETSNRITISPEQAHLSPCWETEQLVVSFFNVTDSSIDQQKWQSKTMQTCENKTSFLAFFLGQQTFGLTSVAYCKLLKTFTNYFRVSRQYAVIQSPEGDCTTAYWWEKTQEIIGILFLWDVDVLKTQTAIILKPKNIFLQYLLLNKYPFSQQTISLVQHKINPLLVRINKSILVINKCICPASILDHSSASKCLWSQFLPERKSQSLWKMFFSCWCSWWWHLSGGKWNLELDADGLCSCSSAGSDSHWSHAGVSLVGEQRQACLPHSLGLQQKYPEESFLFQSFPQAPPFFSHWVHHLWCLWGSLFLCPACPAHRLCSRG